MQKKQILKILGNGAKKEINRLVKKEKIRLEDRKSKTPKFNLEMFDFLEKTSRLPYVNKKNRKAFFEGLLVDAQGKFDWLRILNTQKLLKNERIKLCIEMSKTTKNTQEALETAMISVQNNDLDFLGKVLLKIVPKIDNPTALSFLYTVSYIDSEESELIIKKLAKM